MTRDCIFCKIVRDELPANRIYEDKDILAFLDIKPISEGHTLVIPKKHYDDIYRISEKEVACLFKTVKRIAYAVKNGMNAEGISIVQNNGRAAGQIVFHLHVHIIPQYFEKKSHRSPETSEAKKLDKIAKKMRQFIK